MRSVMEAYGRGWIGGRGESLRCPTKEEVFGYSLDKLHRRMGVSYRYNHDYAILYKYEVHTKQELRHSYATFSQQDGFANRNLVALVRGKFASPRRVVFRDVDGRDMRRNVRSQGMEERFA